MFWAIVGALLFVFVVLPILGGFLLGVFFRVFDFFTELPSKIYEKLTEKLGG